MPHQSHDVSSAVAASHWLLKSMLLQLEGRGFRGFNAVPVVQRTSCLIGLSLLMCSASMMLLAACWPNRVFPAFTTLWAFGDDSGTAWDPRTVLCDVLHHCSWQLHSGSY